jgi:hypothetical protein
MTNPLKRALLALTVGTVALGATGCLPTSGCQGANSRTRACIFQQTMNPGKPVSNDVKPVKTGKACAFNVLRVVALGDSRITTAASNAGITKIASIDSEAFDVLSYWNVYSRYCTVVKGE